MERDTGTFGGKILKMSLFNWFKQDPKKLFMEFTPEGSEWRVVTWNFDLNQSSGRRWVIEVHGPKSTIIQWERDKEDRLKFLQGKKQVFSEKVSKDNQTLVPMMNLALHSVLKHSLDSNNDFMLTPVTGATTMDFQNETRVLQWIQASFGTVTRALDSMKGKRDLILTGACFSGIVPESGERVLRVIIFNLDIFYYMRDDNSLQIVVFDDKNTGHGESKTPTFQQIIKVTKPQFYDEIIKLLHRIANAGEIG